MTPAGRLLTATVLLGTALRVEAETHDHPMPVPNSASEAGGGVHSVHPPATAPYAHDSDSRPSPPAAALPEPESGAAVPPPTHAADTLFDADEMEAARAQLRNEHGGFVTSMLLVDRLESRSGDAADGVLWDAQGWHGGDIHRFWWKSDGAARGGADNDDAEIQALYSRAITPFFNLQAGLRHDLRMSRRRTHAVLGVQGLLPYVFEIDAALFLSDHDEWTGRFEAEYDLRVRQKLVLQPRFDLEFAIGDSPDLLLGSGIVSVAAGFRLRHEFRRELAPYLGIEWFSLRGESAVLARVAGEDVEGWHAVLGLRAWF